MPTDRNSLRRNAMRLYLIDGTYELFRAFFAVPSSQNEQGAEVGAVRGLARSMLALLRSEPVTHVAVAFDHVIESFRNRLFPGYKTGEGLPFEPPCRASPTRGVRARRARRERSAW
jgi:5'-3' exonuclease